MSLTLAKDGIFKLTVKSVSDKAIPFNGTGASTKVFYNHPMVLVDDDGFEYPCQITDVKPDQKYVNTGDYVEIKVKAFTKKVYTITFEKLIRPAAKHTIPVAIKGSNPNMNGTAAAVALSLAIERCKYEQCDEETLLAKADSYLAWLISKQ